MVEIECLACRKTFRPKQLSDTVNYDTDNYDGQIVCEECESLLYVKLVKGKVQKYKIIKDKSAFSWTDFVLRMQKAQNLQEEKQ